MSPDVDFVLTEDGHKAHATLLAQQGIKVCPKSRETVEDLENGGISHVCTSGLLLHNDCEFVYHLYQDTESIRLTVDAFVHNRSTGEALVAAIGRVFPQPERGFPQSPRPERKLDNDRIVTTLGCVIALACFIALCVFVVLGIRSVL
jgi:hypothetical protein